MDASTAETITLINPAEKIIGLKRFTHRKLNSCFNFLYFLCLFVLSFVPSFALSFNQENKKNKKAKNENNNIM